MGVVRGASGVKKFKPSGAPKNEAALTRGPDPLGKKRTAFMRLVRSKQ